MRIASAMTMPEALPESLIVAVLAGGVVVAAEQHPLAAVLLLVDGDGAVAGFVADGVAGVGCAVGLRRSSGRRSLYLPALSIFCVQVASPYSGVGGTMRIASAIT